MRSLPVAALIASACLWTCLARSQPYEGNFYNTGRETFLLPVHWTDDGWPVILPPGEPVPYLASVPGNAGASGAAPVPVSGNFTWRDEFDGPALSPLWIMLRRGS